MKKFIGTLFLVIVITMIADRMVGYVFQYFYQTTTTTDEHKISSVMYRTQAPVLFMGSSRCHHHYIPSMVSPGCTFSGTVILYVLLYITVAVSGRTSNNALMSLRALCTALCWNHSPMR